MAGWCRDRAPLVRLLRIQRPAGLISAEVFDRLFVRHLSPLFDLEVRPPVEWCNSVLGSANAPFDAERAARALAASTAGFAYVCPGHELIPLAPLLVALRNLSGSPVRLLLIAHAPGVYLMEWVLLAPLLRPGDLIIAPSESARRTIEFLDPELVPFVRVIPHPMQPLLAVAKQVRSEEMLLVSLGRLHPDKLVHRQIEAIALLRERWKQDLRLEIAGPLDAVDAEGEAAYVRALRARVRRLGLENCVSFVGPICEDESKARFLSSASALVYLSVSPEEAYPKSTIEALGVGVPVVGTRWDGFPDTVGQCGRLVPARATASTGAVDVDPVELAEAIQYLAENPPPPSACRKQAQRFGHERMALRYQQTLGAEVPGSLEPGSRPEALPDARRRASPPEGLLSRNAILKPFSWRELFELHLDEMPRIRQSWQGHPPLDGGGGAKLRGYLLASTNKAVQYFLAGLEAAPGNEPSGRDPDADSYGGSLAERMAKAVESFACPVSKEIALLMCLDEGRCDLVARGLEVLAQEGRSSRGMDYLRIETSLAAGEYRKAWDILTRGRSPSGLSEDEAAWVRLVARICRLWQQPRLAKPWLDEWLSRYPDSTLSGQVWLDSALLALKSSETGREGATTALERARELLGPVPAVQKIEQLVLSRNCESLLGEECGR